ncbi:alpha/beta hydrolase family protein [Candidatus Poribacteria bacterium]
MIRVFNLLILFTIPFAFFLFSTLKAKAEDENLSVLSGWMKWTDAPNMLYNHLAAQAFQHLEERASKMLELEKAEQWLRRQAEVRQILMTIVGPFPEETPLNPQVVGILQKDGYRVEKVIYESMPGLCVTAGLFIPDNLEGKTPAILYASGHTGDGFRSPAYQTVILNLVKKGFIVLAYDPIGQGERLQYFDAEKGNSRVGGSTKEHSYVGAQCFISGRSFARYRTWDGIRSIDYLMTRDEVDPERIGLTGRSGGGTLTAYIAACDDRVYAAAPECYISGFKRLLESAGPQDAEQNFYHGIASSIDHADLLEVRVPKPTLMITTTRDFFSIQGARETYAEAKRAYRALGKAENMEMVEDDAPHQSTQRNREAMYAFFQKHLNLPGSSEDEEIELLTPEELRVTETGQVSTSLKGETVFNINRQETQKLLENLEESRKDIAGHLASVKQSAMKLSGYVEPDSVPGIAFTGRYQREGYCIEKYMIDGERECVIPALLMIPNDGEKHPVVIYIHPDGKNAEASEGGEMEWFVKQGFAVLSPDLIGTGETGPGRFKGDAYIGEVSYNVWFASILIARSIVGIRAGDIVRLVKFLQSRGDIDSGSISAVARGEMCPVLLHATAFEDSIKRIALVEPPISYSSVVMNEYYSPRLIPATVAGALTAYDLPDITACLAPRELSMINVTDHNKERAIAELMEHELSIVRSAYSAAKAEGKLYIGNWEAEQGMDKAFPGWVKR